jgi:hypothetical protein
MAEFHAAARPMTHSVHDANGALREGDTYATRACSDCSNRYVASDADELLFLTVRRNSSVPRGHLDR